MSFIWNLRTLKQVAPPSNKFSEADLDYNRLFEDDYVHRNHLTVNYTGKGLNFAVKNKATIDLKGSSLHKADPKTSMTSKILTQVNGATLEVKLDNKGTVRLWHDLGTYGISGYPLTVTGKLKTNNSFNKLSWAPTFQWRAGDVLCWSRIHVKDGGNVFWGNRTQYERGGILAGLMTKLSLASTSLSKWTVFGSYQVNPDTAVYSEFAQKGFGALANPTSHLTVASTYRGRLGHYGLQVNYNLYQNDPLNVQLATVQKVNNQTTVRAKIDHKTNLAVSAKYVHSSNLNVQVGSAVCLTEPATFTTDKVVPVPVGVSLNFTYA